MRSLALSLLVALGVALAAPALTPATAFAATETPVVQGIPAIPWQSIARWMVKNALTLLMLLEEIAHDLQNGPDQPPPQSPPPAPCNVELG
jgi:hypothetical protein